ncbi:MAG TPA: tyrosine-type recombinase/integrase [Chitinophagaceae bacterium]|nr:tyrosine-type recombinase/integrase [Chitinophagaceae bacterium]
MLVPFDQYFKEYTHFLRFEKRYSQHTVNAYLADLSQFRDYLKDSYTDISLADITHLQLRSWLADLREKDNLAPRSLNRKISSVNGYFKYLMRNGFAAKNPCAVLHSVRLPERVPVFLKTSETEQLLEETSFGEGFAAATDRLILELLYISGMRRAELISLREEDIEWSLRQLRILGKGNKERLLPVSGVFLDTLRDYIALKKAEGLDASPHLLVLASGKMLYEKYVYHTVKRHLAMVTTLKKKSPHVLRHTFATHLLNNGASIQAIKELLGHSSIAATQVYTHINIEELKKVHKLNHPKG